MPAEDLGPALSLSAPLMDLTVLGDDEDDLYFPEKRRLSTNKSENGRVPPPPRGLLFPASVRQRLDAGALEALGQLEASEAEAIATRLELAGPSVRNPSAYVHRAVNNAKKRGNETTKPAAFRGKLDANAVAALDELPIDAARAILDELASKAQGKVRNPSAYVVKAVGNARRGVLTTTNPTSPPLDNRHRRPSTTTPPRFTAEEEPVTPTRSFSALGLSTTTTTTSPNRHSTSPPPPSAVDASRVWSDGAARNLDSKAAAALLALPAHRAVQILTELRRKRATIRNPSAYVMRATTNAMTAPPIPRSNSLDGVIETKDGAFISRAPGPLSPPVSPVLDMPKPPPIRNDLLLANPTIFDWPQSAPKVSFSSTSSSSISFD